MLVKITEVIGENLTVEKDGEKKTYIMEDRVKGFARAGPADITFNDETKKVSFIHYESTTDPSKEGKKSFDDMVKLEDLLSDAHRSFKGKFSVRTEMLSIDLENKYALFKAVVEVDGRIYEGHGDSTKDNVTGDKIKVHFIRMAETRAVARALRWATNNATCAEEEK